VNGLYHHPTSIKLQKIKNLCLSLNLLFRLMLEVPRRSEIRSIHNI